MILRYLLLLVLLSGSSSLAAVPPQLDDAAATVGAKLTVPAQQTRQRMRQGGETAGDAVVIPGLPFSDAGTTVGYADDYDAVCPYVNSNAPDVVYRFTPAGRVVVDVDMCGSGYDTKIYLLDSNLGVIACNDDFYFGAPCGNYVSRIEQVALSAGETVYVVVDGYGDAAGDYELTISEYVECYLAYPAEAQDEGEPSLHDGYADEYNSGCNSDSGAMPLQSLTGGAEVAIYGRSGWYYRSGVSRRDTDWYLGVSEYQEQIEVTVESEHPAYLYLVGNFWDCENLYAIDTLEVAPCEAAGATFAVGAYQEFVLWVGPTVSSAPDGFIGYEFNYVLWVAGLHDPLVTETTTWGAVKSLYR